jgi:hypothetical protein
MAAGAQRYQIQIVIVPLPAAKLFVMDLKVLSGTTELTFPAIAAQDLFSELIVRLRIKPQARLLGPNPIHEAFSVTS